MIGKSSHCIRCNEPVVSCVLPAICGRCESLELEKMKNKINRIQPANKMEADIYQKLILRTECSNNIALNRLIAGLGAEDYYYMRLLHAVIGLGKEVGEIQDVVTKLVYYGKQLTPEQLRTTIKDEAGDILWFVALLLNAVNVPMSEVMEANINKLRARYPEKFTEELCDKANRNLEAESNALGK